MEPLAIRIPPRVLERMEERGTSKLLTLGDRERAEWLAQQANKQPGDLTGYDCPECLNRGYIVTVGADGRRTNRECRCMARRRSEKIISKSGLSDLLERCTLESWDAQELWQKKLLSWAQKWAKEPSGWFYLAGTPGTGKTHLCAALCGILMNQGMECRYMLWRDVSVQAKAVVNDEAEYRRIIDPLKRVRVLYIDDLFKTGKGQQPTTGDVNLAFEILNSRYNDTRKITLLSSELTMTQILNIDEAVGSRIYERSKHWYFDLTGKPNWRLRN